MHTRVTQVTRSSSGRRVRMDSVSSAESFEKGPDDTRDAAWETALRGAAVARRRSGSAASSAACGRN